MAVVSGGEVLGEVRLRSGMGHSKRLMPAVAFLLDGLGIAAPDVEGYAVTAGSGLVHRPPGGPELRPGTGPGQRPSVPWALHAGRARGADRRGRADAGRGDGRLSRRGLRLRLRVRRPAPGRTRDRRSRRRRSPGSPPGTAFIGDGATRYREEIRAAVPDARFPRPRRLSRRHPRAAGGAGAGGRRRGRAGRAAAPLPAGHGRARPRDDRRAARASRRRRWTTWPRWSRSRAAATPIPGPSAACATRMAPAAGAGAVLVLRAPWTARDEDRGIRAYCAYQVVADEAHIHNLAVVPRPGGGDSRAGCSRSPSGSRRGKGARSRSIWRSAPAMPRPARCIAHGISRGGEAAGVLFGAGRGRGAAFPRRACAREP